MSALYFWIFTAIISVLWWLFIVVKIHAYKFKNFSTLITQLTTLLLIFLIFLTLLWYIVIFYFTNNTQIKVSNYSWYDTKEVNY